MSGFWFPSQHELYEHGERYYGFTEDYDPVSWVYFLDAGDLIKIGTTDHLARRLRTIQASSSVLLELVLILGGNRRIEAMIHEQFKHLRRRGEWFDKGDDLLHAINAELAQYAKQIADIREGRARYGPTFPFTVSIDPIGFPLSQRGLL